MSTTTTITKSSTNLYWFVIYTFPLWMLAIIHVFQRGDSTSQSTSPPPLDYGTGQMFDIIASRYDLINRVLAINMDQGWRRVLSEKMAHHIQSFKDPASQRIQLLDVATGTADVALMLSKVFDEKMLQDVHILGVDPSPNMLQIGHAKVLGKNIQLEVGDSRLLSTYEFVSDRIPFDGVTMSFGIRNVPEKDRSKVFCEFAKLLSTQGIIGIMEFSEPDGNSILEKLARLFIRHVVPKLGAILSGAPKEYMHLQNSINEFPSPTKFKELIEHIQCTTEQQQQQEIFENQNNDDPTVDAEPAKEECDTTTATTTNVITSFVVKDIHNLNFGSVQIYMIEPVIKDIVIQ